MTDAQQRALAEIAIKAILSEDMPRSSLVTACARMMLQTDADMGHAEWLEQCSAVYAEIEAALQGAA
jgi:hypothetical protein